DCFQNTTLEAVWAVPPTKRQPLPCGSRRPKLPGSPNKIDRQHPGRRGVRLAVITPSPPTGGGGAGGGLEETGGGQTRGGTGGGVGDKFCVIPGAYRVGV